MSDVEVGYKVLEVLKEEKEPVRPDDLYAKLQRMCSIGEFQGRRAVVELAVDHRIEVTPDRMVKLPT